MKLTSKINLEVRLECVEYYLHAFMTWCLCIRETFPFVTKFLILSLVRDDRESRLWKYIGWFGLSHTSRAVTASMKNHDRANIQRGTYLYVTLSTNNFTIDYTHFSIYADLIFVFLELCSCHINTIFLIHTELFLELYGLNCEPSDPDDPLPQ
jgi:hypothetical protein